jgi:hypothetical protein
MDGEIVTTALSSVDTKTEPGVYRVRVGGDSKLLYTISVAEDGQVTARGGLAFEADTPVSLGQLEQEGFVWNGVIEVGKAMVFGTAGSQKAVTRRVASIEKQEEAS